MDLNRRLFTPSNKQKYRNWYMFFINSIVYSMQKNKEYSYKEKRTEKKSTNHANNQKKKRKKRGNRKGAISARSRLPSFGWELPKDERKIYI